MEEMLQVIAASAVVYLLWKINELTREKSEKAKARKERHQKAESCIQGQTPGDE